MPCIRARRCGAGRPVLSLRWRLGPARFGSYTPTDVQLNLTSGIGQITGLTLNQSAVAAALDTSFNTGGGTLPGLLGLSLAQLPAALDALSGEGVSGTQETAFGAADMFTSIMMDQGAFWRNGETIDVNGVAFAGEPLQYAPSKKSKMSDHPAFKERAPPAPYQPRWRAWLTGFDGAFKLAGEAGIGSADLSHNTGGLAGGSIINSVPICWPASPPAAVARISRSATA